MEPIIKNRAARERVVQKKPDASQKKKPKQVHSSPYFGTFFFDDRFYLK